MIFNIAIGLIGLFHAAVFATKPAFIPFQTKPATNAIIKSIPGIQGDILDSKCWEDKEGKACVIIWGTNNLGGNENGSHSELNGAKYQYTPTGYKQKWKIHDFSDRKLQWLTLDSNSLKITDIDGDGAAEDYFFWVFG